MKILCGIDIIEVDRIQESIESLGENFLNKVYTKNEIEYCYTRYVIGVMLKNAYNYKDKDLFKGLNKQEAYQKIIDSNSSSQEQKNEASR